MISHPPNLTTDHVVALDPGTRNVGLALFRFDPAAYRYVLAAALDLHPPGTAAGAVEEIVLALGPWRVSGGGVSFVAEYPRAYRDRREAHEDIAALQAVVDRLAAAPWAYPWARVVRVAPSQWKGQVPKPIAHERYRRALVTEVEHEIWGPLGPDGRDAVGIGLWATGRYPGTPATVAGNRRR